MFCFSLYLEHKNEVYLFEDDLIRLCRQKYKFRVSDQKGQSQLGCAGLFGFVLSTVSESFKVSAL